MAHVKGFGWTFLGVMAAVAASPGSVLAQDAAPPSGTAVGGGEIGEIIVTAQRREQSLQKVPVAVSTVNAAQIEARRLNNIDALSGIAPNLVITTGNSSSSSTQIAIRGSVTTNNTINYDPAVGLYLDGAYVGKASGSVFDIGDLERVEVLRGPQGTLFGRNTLAGAISFTTRKPSDKLRVEGEASYGNYNYMAFRGLVNVPVTDTLFVKVSGQIQKRDGFTRLVPDPQGIYPSAVGDVDDRDRYSIMAQVRWLATERLTFDYSYDRSVTREHPFVGLYSVDPSSPAAPYVIPTDNRPKTASLDVRNRDFSTVYGHSLTAAYDLGAATLKSITAYRHVKIDQGPLGQDIDGAPIPLALGGFDARYKQFSQELQLTGSAFGDALTYVVGGYYFKDNAQAANQQKYFGGVTYLNTHIGLRSRAYAAYAQADYKVTDKLTVTGGLRWTSERKTVNRLYQVIDTFVDGVGVVHFDPPLTLIDIRKDNSCYSVVTGSYDTCSPSNHHTFSNVSPTGIIAYQFTPDINVYAKYSVGFRSGSYNADAGPSANPLDPSSDVLSYFKPEKNESIEVGFKTRFFDRRLTFNFAAFYNTEKDKQVASFLGKQAASTVNNNAGKARIKGIEVEVDARPTDYLHLYGSLGLLRAKFLSYKDLSTVDGDVYQVADNRYFPKAPRTTITVGADLQVYENEGRGRVTISGDMQYQSKTFSLPGQFQLDPLFPLVAVASDQRIPATTLVNGRLRWDDIPLGSSGLKGYAMLWAKNLTNLRKVNNKISFGPNFSNLVDSNYMEPRTYGVTLGFKY